MKRIAVDEVAIAEDYKNGLSVEKIGDKYSISPKTVKRALTRLGIAIRSPRETKAMFAGIDCACFKNLDDREFVSNLYIDCALSETEMANSIGCTRSMVRTALARFKIPLRKPGTLKANAKILKKLNDVNYLADAHDNRKLSPKQIAEELGISSNGAVIDRMKKLGVTRRTNKEAAIIAHGAGEYTHSLLSDKDWLTNEYKTKTTLRIGRELGLSSGDHLVQLYLKKHEIKATRRNTTSYLEYQVSKLLSDNNISHLRNCRSLITSADNNKLEIDIVIPQSNLAIEINGVVWHSTKFKKDTKYHEFKRISCKNTGFRLLSLYGDDIHHKWPIVERIILNAVGKCQDKVTDARKCKINHHPDIAKTKEFLDKWHIQGQAAQSKTLALELDGETVAVMSFKGNELSRYATSIKVRGGFSRLLKNCGLEGDIISFVDLDTFSGDAYEAVGFKIDGYLKPDYKYVIGNKRVHKFCYRKKRFMNDDELIFEDGKTEFELAEMNGLYRIYNSGMLRLKYSLTPQ